MIRPSLAQARELAPGYTVLPLALELYADLKTPIEILRGIQQHSDQFCILESVTSDNSWGRYTFIAYDPTMVIQGCDGEIRIDGVVQESSTPTDTLRQVLAEYRSPRIDYFPPFTGGLVGSISYDFIKYIHTNLELAPSSQPQFDDFYLMLMQRVIAFDHLRQKMFLIVHIPTQQLEESYIEGVTKLKDMERMLLGSPASGKAPPTSCGRFVPQFTQEQYCSKVAEIQQYIRKGEIFQATLSNRLTAPYQGNLLEAYRKLRTTNPSPYMVYFRLRDMEIAGASPETLVSLKDGVVCVHPLAGTCPRGSTPLEDAQLAQQLLADPKELAEHAMAVDAGRSDLGKVCTFGSVRMEQHRQVKGFSHVSHLVSKVSGVLHSPLDAVDVIGAALPAAPLSGIPKRRACEILDQVEGTKRGPYAGAMGYIDFTGNMDLCAGIRMAVLQGGQVHVQAGSTILADSVPEQEYHEMMCKAQAIIDALQPLKEVGI